MKVLKTKKEHEEFLKTASWDDVAEVLIYLEQQRYNFKSFMTNKELRELESIIDLYDASRQLFLNRISKESGFNRAISAEIQSYSEMEPDIGDLEDGY